MYIHQERTSHYMTLYYTLCQNYGLGKFFMLLSMSIVKILKKFILVLTKKELSSLPEDSSDIYKRNMVNRYIIRPSQEKK